MSLSAHLVETYDRKPKIYPQPSRPTAPTRPSFMDQSFSYGNRSMDPEASWMSSHGQVHHQGYPPSSSAGGGFSRWSEEKVASLQVRLARKLGPEYVTQRPGPGGGPKLSYIEGWKVINLANEVFGFNGWSSSIVSLTTDYIDVTDQGRVSLNVTAIVRITLADGCWHEDVGCGQAENQRGKGPALDKAKKEAVTDATKRALRTFGNVLGNCMYDKEYTKEVVKMKIPPPKFERAELERRPEFAEPGPAGPSRLHTIPSHASDLPRPPLPQNGTAQRGAMNPPPTPIKSVYDASEDDMFVDEHFDGEFIAMADDSIFETEQTSRAPALKAEPQIPHAGATNTIAPAYQHRHRPDNPIPPQRTGVAPGGNGSAARQAFLLSEQLGLPRTPQRPTGDTTTIFETPMMDAGANSGSSETLPDIQPRKPIAAPAQPEKPSAATSALTAAQARRQAVLAQCARPSSPQIPSGGVDAVAQKATTNLVASARALGLEEEIAIENKGGFASARGMKRTISGGDTSPSKAGTGTGVNMPNRMGPRRVLGEIPQETGGEDWSMKRQRAG